MTDKKEYNEILVNEVRYMRGLQKAYFKTRDKDILKQSIQAEMALDKLLEGIS